MARVDARTPKTGALVTTVTITQAAASGYELIVKSAKIIKSPPRLSRSKKHTRAVRP